MIKMLEFQKAAVLNGVSENRKLNLNGEENMDSKNYLNGFFMEIDNIELK